MNRGISRRLQALDDHPDSAAVFAALERIEREHAATQTRADHVAADVHREMQRLPFKFEDALHRALWTRMAVTGETLAEVLNPGTIERKGNPSKIGGSPR